MKTLYLYIVFETCFKYAIVLFQDTSPRLMESLRILTALEDLLGSLGPQINIILSKAITLENNKEGSGNVLLEDQDVAAILQMTKEKLSGQIIAGSPFS